MMTEWVFRRTGSSLVYHDTEDCDYLEDTDGPMSKYRRETAEYWNNLEPCSGCLGDRDD
jgi:hypothetical protein